MAASELCRPFYLVPVNPTSKAGPWDSSSTTVLLHLWGWGHLSCAKAVLAALWSVPKALAVSIPWAPEWLRAGALPVAVCWPMASVTQQDGGDRKKATQAQGCERGKQN